MSGSRRRDLVGWLYLSLCVGFLVASFWASTAGSDRMDSIARVVAMSILITTCWGAFVAYMLVAVIYIIASAICSYVARRFRR